MSIKAFHEGIQRFAERSPPENIAKTISLANANHKGGRCVHVATVPYEALDETWGRKRVSLEGFASIEETHIASTLAWTRDVPGLLTVLHTQLEEHHSCHQALFMFVCFPPGRNVEPWIAFATLHRQQ